MHERTERPKLPTLTLILASLIAATSLLSGCSSSFTSQ